jgi:hypothetical protein
MADILSHPVTVEQGFTVIAEADLVEASEAVVAFTTVREYIDAHDACTADPVEDPGTTTTTTGGIVPPPTQPPTGPTTTVPVTTVPPTTVPPTSTSLAPTESWPAAPACQREADGSGSIAIWVSNQSFEDPSVDMIVEVDGEVVAEDTYHVEGQHTWIHYEVPVGPGFHEIVVDTPSGDDVAWNTGAEAGNGVVVSWWGLATYEDDDEQTEPVVLSVHDDCETVGFA